MTAQAPPLWTWVLAVALAGLFLAIFAFDPAGRVDPYADLNLRRLEQSAAQDGRLVVIIGDSKAQCAVGFDPEITAQVQALGVPATVVRVTKAGGDFASFEPAFERIALARPALVLVQDDLLLFKHPPAPDPEAVSWRARVDRALRTRLGLPRFRANYPQVGARACVTYTQDHRQLIDIYRTDRSEHSNATPADQTGYLSWFAALRAGGAKVVLVDFTRSPLAEEYLPSSLRDGASANLDRLAAQGLPRIAPPGPYPQTDYADLGHMNASGRRDLTGWLAPQVATLLGDD